MLYLTEASSSKKFRKKTFIAKKKRPLRLRSDAFDLETFRSKCNSLQQKVRENQKKAEIQETDRKRKLNRLLSKAKKAKSRNFTLSPKFLEGKEKIYNQMKKKQYEQAKQTVKGSWQEIILDSKLKQKSHSRLQSLADSQKSPRNLNQFKTHQQDFLDYSSEDELKHTKSILKNSLSFYRNLNYRVRIERYNMKANRKAYIKPSSRFGVISPSTLKLFGQ